MCYQGLESESRLDSRPYSHHVPAADLQVLEEDLGSYYSLRSYTYTEGLVLPEQTLAFVFAVIFSKETEIGEAKGCVVHTQITPLILLPATVVTVGE